MSRPAAESTSTALSARQIWTRARGAALVIALILIGGIALATLRSTESHGVLDPRSADPTGSRAVAELLRDNGVAVTTATSLDEATAATDTSTTLLVTTPDLLTKTQQAALRATMTRSPARTVLVAAPVAPPSPPWPRKSPAPPTPR
ncbi:hypothetical protein SNARM312S_01769 [Streptomyces narbonensis]